jgi:hypothetical protein
MSIDGNGNQNQAVGIDEGQFHFFGALFDKKTRHLRR